jgi:predicted Zn-dependent peptidase
VKVTGVAVIALLVAAGTLPGHAQTSAELELPVVEHRLANGMRFLVLPRPGAPTVSFVVQYGVGGVNEVRGHTGTAHLLEHLLFKGSETLGTLDLAAERSLFARMDILQDSILTLEAGRRDTTSLAAMRGRIGALEEEAGSYVRPNEFSRVLSTHGARGLNATTDWESTKYFVEMPANRVELWFLLESDRMSNPVFRQFYTERDVVAEERRLRVETQPGGLLFEAHVAAAFTAHPYGQPVVGYMSDITRLRRQGVAEYYRRYYGAGNAIVAIVGDVEPEQIVTWAEEYFGHLPTGDPPPAVLTKEPPQRGERRVEVVLDAQPQVRIAWHVVEGSHEDTPALRVLSALLTGGRSSRLHRRLVTEGRIANTVYSSLGPGSRFPAIFTIEATPRAPHTTLDIEAAVYAELDSLMRDPPSEAELQRIRNQLEANRVRRLTSNMGLALQLAESTSTFGDWRTTFEATGRLLAVGPGDIGRVLEAFFDRENRTVATLTPSDSAAPR